jgi:hypothetical protein
MWIMEVMMFWTLILGMVLINILWLMRMIRGMLLPLLPALLIQGKRSILLHILELWSILCLLVILMFFISSMLPTKTILWLCSLKSQLPMLKLVGLLMMGSIWPLVLKIILCISTQGNVLCVHLVNTTIQLLCNVQTVRCR